MENNIENKLIYSNEKINKNKYSNNQPCNCCNYFNYFCYCECNCHKDKYKENEDIDFENAPNLNINELKMKSLKDYSYKNQNVNLNKNYYHTLKNINSSKSTENIENYNNNGNQLFSLNKKTDNNINKIKMELPNKLEKNVLNSQKNLQTNLNYINNLKDNNDFYFKEVASHYKTQSNFNNLKKYYQLNNNNKNTILNYNNSLKSQIEFNKLLNSIKGNDNISCNNNNNDINNIKINNSNLKYNTLTERENKHYSKINGYEINSIRKDNNLEENITQVNNVSRYTVNNKKNNKIFRERNYTNFNDFCSNTEYNKPFRSFNLDNGNIFSLNDKKIINNNTSIQIPSNNNIKNNNYSSRHSLNENISNKKNGGDNSDKDLISSKNIKLDDDSISYNSSTLNKSYNKLVQNLDINLNNLSKINNISNTEPRYSNTSKNTENDNVNIKFNYLDTNSCHNENDNKNELIESKEINGEENNNFIVTFGARGNNEIKNIIASAKKELNTPNNINYNKNNGKRPENSDQKINNIIIDYENLKKRYAPNKLFIGLKNNLKDLNENININKNIITDNYSNKSTINTIRNNNYSQSKFELFFKSDSNKMKEIIENNEKYKKQINSLNNELKESKKKIEELMIIIDDSQKEINSLKGQITKSKKDSLNESKITINNISSSNNLSNKTKIGKDSFIIKIPENLIRNKLSKDKSRNNSISNTNNNNINTYANIRSSGNNQDKFINLNNNINNISNQISNISNNNTNSNCLTSNNISNNISNNNISCITNNNEIYIKKITTTMKKKFKKSNSQKLRINKIYNKLSLNLFNNNLYTQNNNYNK